MKKLKLFSILALLFMAVTGAVAQTETLLTTITATAKEQASYSTANVATVSFSYTAYGSSAYLANWGWWGYGWSATVNAAEGYTITDTPSPNAYSMTIKIVQQQTAKLHLL